MKSIITLSAVTILTALALVGCGQNSSGNSGDSSATNSSMSASGGAGTTNLPATNSLPVMNTNVPATTN